MILKIDRVYDQHFRSYFFEAENTLGKVIHEVKLREGTSTGKNPILKCFIKMFYLFVYLFIYTVILSEHNVDFSFDVEVATVRRKIILLSCKFNFNSLNFKFPINCTLIFNFNLSIGYQYYFFIYLPLFCLECD